MILRVVIQISGVYKLGKVQGCKTKISSVYMPSIPTTYSGQKVQSEPRLLFEVQMVGIV